MDQTVISEIVQLTLDWLDYLDIYRIEGCTQQDVQYGLSTGGARGSELLVQSQSLSVREWTQVVQEVISRVNAQLSD